MFESWGRWVHHFRWVVVALSVVFLGTAAVWGTSVFGDLNGSSSLDDPHSEAQRISAQVDLEFGSQTTDLVALYSSADAVVDSPAFRTAVEQATARALAQQGDVQSAQSFYTTKDAGFVSADRHSTFVAIRMAANTDDGDVEDVIDVLKAQGLTTQIGGPAAVDLDINDRIPGDIGLAEGIAMPILLIALLFVFGSVVAALMPLLIGVFAVMGAFLMLKLLTLLTPISIFSLNIITILGLGLAVDYGLFIVGRYREELAKGRDVRTALGRTLATAGRTVFISGVLVALAMCSLMLFPQVLLRSLGLGGSAAVLFAMISSLTVLPAVLAVVGHKIDAGKVPFASRRRTPSLTAAAAAAGGKVTGWWGRVATVVMRRPVLFLLGSLVVLGVLASPFAGIRFGGIDERMLPPGAESRVVTESLASQFPNGDLHPIRVLLQNASAQTATAFAGQIKALPGVTEVTMAAQKPTASLLAVSYTGDPSSAEALNLARDVRALGAPNGATMMVGGMPANIVDQLSALSSRLPWMLLLVLGITALVLTIGFGSLIVPLKAMAMNLVSIAAAFGVVTWIFQDGHLSGWLGFTPTGYVEASQPVLMMAILFGLSMDYEVFLLSRIRERWDQTNDNTLAVISGVQQTGRMITTAAVLLCIVVGFFALSGITFIKMIGVGMVVAILVDATLVRLVLVPATMRLLGSANWWAPPFIQRAYTRFGFHESDDDDPPSTASSTTSRSRSTTKKSAEVTTSTPTPTALSDKGYRRHRDTEDAPAFRGADSVAGSETEDEYGAPPANDGAGSPAKSEALTST